MKANGGTKSKTGSHSPLTSNPVPLAAPSVTRATLDGTTARALKLLRGIGINLPVRAALENRGFTENDRREGWELLNRASGYRKEPGLVAGQYDAGVRAAIAALDAWDEDGFAIIRATLERRFPKQGAAVLDELSASTGPDAVIGVSKLLDRLDTLAASHDKTDKAAMAVLGERGVTVAERKKLRAYVETAQSCGTVEAKESETVEEAAAADAEHVQALANLRSWFEEWSAVAKAVVKRRDRLILLGLAKAKRRDNATATASATPVAPPVAPVVPPVVGAPIAAPASTPVQQAAMSNGGSAWPITRRRPDTQTGSRVNRNLLVPTNRKSRTRLKARSALSLLSERT